MCFGCKLTPWQHHSFMEESLNNQALFFNVSFFVMYIMCNCSVGNIWLNCHATFQRNLIFSFKTHAVLTHVQIFRLNYNVHVMCRHSSLHIHKLLNSLSKLGSTWINQKNDIETLFVMKFGALQRALRTSQKI